MPKGVYIRTKEHNLNLSKSHKGKKLPMEQRQKMSNTRTGMKGGKRIDTKHTDNIFSQENTGVFHQIEYDKEIIKIGFHLQFQGNIKDLQNSVYGLSQTDVKEIKQIILKKLCERNN